MANYLIQILDPTGHSIHDTRVELEDMGDVDSLTGLMTDPDGVRADVSRFPIVGGNHPNAQYSILVSRQ